MEGPRLFSVLAWQACFLFKSVVAGPVLHHMPLSRTGALVSIVFDPWCGVCCRTARA